MRKVDKKFFVILITFVIFIAIVLVIPRNLLVFDYSNIEESRNEKELKKDKDYEEIKKLDEERFLIVYDDEDPLSKDTKDNVLKVLEYIKKPSNVIEKAEAIDSLEKYSVVITTFEALEKFKNLDKVDEYVEDGGNLVVAQRPYISDEIEPYKELLGIEEFNSLGTTSGIEFFTNVLVKGAGTSSSSPSNDSMKATLDKDTIVHAITAEKVPMIWENEYGEGNVLFFNGQMLSSKNERGVLIGLISLISDEFIYPIVNSNVMFIDDFPCPLPDTDIPQITEEYNKDFEEFFKDIWWPDMVSISKRYDLLYTGYYIENYEDQIDNFQQYESQTGMLRNIATYGRELLKINGEIGLHGFNHQPLAYGEYEQSLKLDYKTWKTEEDMIEAINIAVDHIKDVFPNYEITSYVAPSNILSKEGRASLKKAIPTLKTISTIYDGPEDEALIQEFEIGDDGVIDFPRISYGYFYTDEEYYTILKGVTLHGIVSHFIHGDDILDEERSFGEKWSKMYKSFDKLLGKIDDDFQWIEKDTATNGAMKLKDTLENEVVFKYDEDMITGSCNNFSTEGNYILRSKRPIKKVSGCKVEEIDENIYLVKNNSEKFTIELGE